LEELLEFIVMAVVEVVVEAVGEGASNLAAIGVGKALAALLDGLKAILERLF
jgi:hypothetical protein